MKLLLGFITLVGLAATLRPPVSIWNLPKGRQPQTVTLAWDRSTSPMVVGYHVYQGIAPGVYTNFYSVGNVTNLTLTNLGVGVFHFAATAIDAFYFESDYSNEAIWTNLPPPPVTNFLLSVSIQQSADFTNWSALTNFSLNVSNSGQPLYWRALMNIQPR